MELPAEKYYGYALKAYETKDKAGNITAEKWRAVFYYKDADGKRRQKNVTLETEGRDKGRSTQIQRAASNEAEALRQKLNQEVVEEAKRAEEEAKRPKPVRCTVADCVRSYIEDCDIQRSTATSYRGMLKNAIAPKLGGILLDDLTKEDCKKWIGWVSRKYSRPYASNSLRLLKGALSYACDDEQGWVGRNVAVNVKVPKADKDESASKPNALTDAECARLLNIVNTALYSPDGFKDLPFMLAVKIAIYTGLRRSEICALQWKSVDFDNGTVSVTQSIGHTNSEFYVKDPKSKSSYRTVECPDELMRDLAERKRAMQEQCMELGVPLTGEHYVIGGADGSFLKPPRIDDHWRALSKNLHLMGTQNSPVPFHGLRHTYATMLIQSNEVDITTVSAMLGHSKTSITLDRYASTGSKAKRNAANVLGGILEQGQAKHANDGQVIELGKTGTDN